jgi:hypothetical protein
MAANAFRIGASIDARKASSKLIRLTSSVRPTESTRQRYFL